MDLFDGLHLTPFGFTSLALAGALVAGLCAYLLQGPARRFGFVARRRPDRFGGGGVPLTGGIALMAGVAAPMTAMGWPLRPGHIIALAGFFAVGLADDILELRPAVKFASQLVVGSAAALALTPSWPHAGTALCVFLFLVNACNYLDNMDGLLAGVVLMQAVALLYFPLSGATGAPLLVWTLPAVLLLNLPPAKLYLGDSGSHLLGALLAVDVVALLTAEPTTRPLLPLLVLFLVPVADVTTVTVARLRQGLAPWQGGTDHLSHRLVRGGFDVPRAVGVLVLASGVCGVASLLLWHS